MNIQIVTMEIAPTIGSEDPLGRFHTVGVKVAIDDGQQVGSVFQSEGRLGAVLEARAWISDRINEAFQRELYT